MSAYSAACKRDGTGNHDCDGMVDFGEWMTGCWCECHEVGEDE